MIIIVLYSPYTATLNQGVTDQKYTDPTQKNDDMSFLIDPQPLKNGLIIFRRADVSHRNWYARVRVPESDRYKVISLKTADINEAKEKAFDHDADVRFRVRHEVPVFEKTFADVAKEYSDFLKNQAALKQITMERWKVIDCHIRLHLNPYVGNLQMAYVNEDKWNAYALWRKENGKTRDKTDPDRQVSDGSIKQEMTTFRTIMRYASDKGYIRERQIPKSKLITDKARREEFTLAEYRQLHTYARSWIKAGRTDYNIWQRTMAYNFMLIMANTGMRTMEARNLRWRDVDIRKDRTGRSFVAMNVRGKGKYRELVAASNVAEYLERIKSISKSTGLNDHVFSLHNGKPSQDLYDNLIGKLLKESGLLLSSSGSRRSTYCFRHTYATFRLMEGIDVYFLAKQMGTSVKMIEDYYGHITPVKNAERILQGIPEWETMDEGAGGKKDGVNASPKSPKAKPRTKKKK